MITIIQSNTLSLHCLKYSETSGKKEEDFLCIYSQYNKIDVNKLQSNNKTMVLYCVQHAKLYSKSFLFSLLIPSVQRSRL